MVSPLGIASSFMKEPPTPEQRERNVLSRLQTMEAIRGVRDRNMLGEILSNKGTDYEAVASEYLSRGGDPAQAFALRQHAQQNQALQVEKAAQMVELVTKAPTLLAEATDQESWSRTSGALKAMASAIGMTLDLPEVYDEKTVQGLRDQAKRFNAITQIPGAPPGVLGQENRQTGEWMTKVRPAQTRATNFTDKLNAAALSLQSMGVPADKAAQIAYGIVSGTVKFNELTGQFVDIAGRPIDLGVTPVGEEAGAEAGPSMWERLFGEKEDEVVGTYVPGKGLVPRETAGPGPSIGGFITETFDTKPGHAAANVLLDLVEQIKEGHGVMKQYAGQMADNPLTAGKMLPERIGAVLKQAVASKGVPNKMVSALIRSIGGMTVDDLMSKFGLSREEAIAIRTMQSNRQG